MDYLSQAVVCHHSFSALGLPGSLCLEGSAELEGHSPEGGERWAEMQTGAVITEAHARPISARASVSLTVLASVLYLGNHS